MLGVYYQDLTCRFNVQSQAHICTRSQAVSNLVVRCTPVVPGRFSAVRSFSTEPVLQNAANPEKPAAPLERPPAASADGSVVVSEKVQRLCDDILALNMLEINQLLKVLKVGTFFMSDSYPYDTMTLPPRFTVHEALNQQACGLCRVVICSLPSASQTLTCEELLWLLDLGLVLRQQR